MEKFIKFIIYGCLDAIKRFKHYFICILSSLFHFNIHLFYILQYSIYSLQYPTAIDLYDEISSHFKIAFNFFNEEDRRLAGF